MTQIIARLILAMLMLPLAVIALAVSFAIVVAVAGKPEFTGIIVAWVVTDCFVVIYWIAIWRSAVKWNTRRVQHTFAAVGVGIAAVACGVSGLLALGVIPLEPAVMFGSSLFPVTYVLATVFAWRESPEERLDRMRMLGPQTVACPICGYNLTGMREARCPECGAVFTLDELLMAQPNDAREGLPET